MMIDWGFAFDISSDSTGLPYPINLSIDAPDAKHYQIWQQATVTLRVYDIVWKTGVKDDMDCSKLPCAVNNGKNYGWDGDANLTSIGSVDWHEIIRNTNRAPELRRLNLKLRNE
ncbi:hypothetical protein H2203_006379 [Taxawa tesnikishii (nom. ined.)]|nr:hypothetical protein H2203_006379 [Dothideales sp. JES 119]